jgi:2',3'-cyclic-nucleotide 2'-phosphodiesterase (5'-nucleotidase family)
MLGACKKEDATVAVAPPPAPKPAKVTFLITGAENGYLLPTPDEAGAAHGGAAEVLGRWVADGHCAGPLSDTGAAACATDDSVVLSTGDNANGQAISSYFKGEPTAEAMRQMGYVASAFGNRELDWSREQFQKNVKTAGFPYLAANVQATDEGSRALGLQAFRVVERGGVKVGVVGLAARKALLTPMPGRTQGLTLRSDTDALTEAVTAARAQGAQVVVLVSDGCLEELPELLTPHPEWKLALAAGRKCDAPYPDQVGATKLVYPGRHWNSYVRAVVSLDLAKPAGEVVVGVEAKNVEVVAAGGASAPEPRLKAALDGWKAKLDGALGEPIGFSRAGLDQESAEMSTWLTTALQEHFHTDVALLNRKGVRQPLPAGALKAEQVYDLIPFDNEIVTLKLTGEQLIQALGNVEARAAGVHPKGEGWVDGKGAAIDAKKTYTVATTDYLYLGGDGFLFHKADPSPTQMHTSIQAALIAWTKGQKSDEKRPLEALLKK